MDLVDWQIQSLDLVPREQPNLWSQIFGPGSKVNIKSGWTEKIEKNEERILIAHWYVYSMAKLCWIILQCHISNQYNALSEDSSLRKVFSGAIGSRVVNQSTDHRTDSITNSSSALVHTIAQAETHTQTQTCLRNHRHTDTHLNTDIPQLLPKQLLSTFTFIWADKNEDGNKQQLNQ